MTTELEIQEIIKKNLPQQVGEVLKNKLKQADLDAETIKRLTKEVKELNSIIVEKENLLLEYRKFDERNSKINEKEENLKLREFNLENKILHVELAAEKEKSEFAKSVALGLVRKVEYKKSIFDSVDEPYKDLLINLNV